MTRQQGTGMAVIAGVIILLLVLLSSCSTKKTITEYVTVHDTLVVGHTDTLRIVSHTIKRDTIREATIQYVTIRQDSDKVDTIKVETVRDHYHTYFVHDSIDTYKAVADSLRAVLKAQEAKKEVKVTNRPRWWEYIVFVALLALWVGLVMWLRRIWKKS